LKTICAEELKTAFEGSLEHARRVIGNDKLSLALASPHSDLPRLSEIGFPAMLFVVRMEITSGTSWNQGITKSSKPDLRFATSAQF
jgi:hypothetical protein